MSIKKMNLLKRYYLYVLAFLAAPTVLLLVYALRGVYPFGQESVLVLDLNAQYIYYYEAFRDVFLGNSSLLYSFSRILGGEMIGTYAYYLASPFSFILLLFPGYLLTEAIMIMILVKVGAAALTLAVYLKIGRNAEPWLIMLFSLIYGLSSYNIIQTMNPMWLDGPIFFPLIILAIEQLVDRKHYAFYVVVLALMFVANFYIGYMVGIIALIYFIYYLYSGNKAKNNTDIIKTTTLFSFSSILAVGGSLWLLLPTFYALSFGKFNFSSPDYSPIQNLDIFDLFSKMLPLSYDSVNVHGHPFIYCSLLSLTLLVLFFSGSGIDNRKKISTALLLMVFFLFFTVSSLDLILHGFQEPVWLNYRYSFIFSFFVIIFAYEAFVSLKPADQNALFKSCLALVIITALTGRILHDYLQPEKTIWLSYALFTLYGLLIYHLKMNPALRSDLSTKEQSRNYHSSKVLQAALLFIIILELFLNTLTMVDGAHREVYYSDRKSYREYIDRLKPITTYLNEVDQDFFRTETAMRRTVNDPMALGIYGVSHSSSVLNQSVINLMYQLGYDSWGHWTSYKGATPVSESLLGIRYILAEEPVNNLYEQVTGLNGISIYRNPYAMPIAYLVDQGYATIELDSYDPFANQNFLLSTLIGEPYTEYFKLLTVEEVLIENLSTTENDGIVVYNIINPGLNAHIEYILATAGKNEMYLYLVSSLPRKVNIWLEHEYIDTFFDPNSTCIIPLGANPGKSSVSLITTPIEGEYFLRYNLFYYLDRPLFEEAMEKLSRNEALVEKISETSLLITAEVKSQQILFTSIPYDQGWQIKVDGEKVKPIKTLDSLLALDLEPGKRLISLTYQPQGLKAGLIISLMSWLLFTASLIYFRTR